MLKTIRITHRDIEGVINNIPYVTTSSRELFDLVTLDCNSYIPFMYFVMVHSSKMYTGARAPMYGLDNYLEATTVTLDTLEFMVQGYVGVDTHLPDKYSSYLYDTIYESVESSYGEPDVSSGNKINTYECKVLMDGLTKVVEIISIIDEYVESLLKSLIVGFEDVSTLNATFVHDTDSLYIMLTDEHDTPSSIRS